MTLKQAEAATLPARSNDRMAPIITLAFWRLRKTWWLLLFITLGLIGAVVMACAVPLFSTITTTAGLRGILSATPTNSAIDLDGYTQGISSRSIQEIQRQFDARFHQDLGPYLAAHSEFSMDLSNLDVVKPRFPSRVYQLDFRTADFPQAGPHLHLIQGRLPQNGSNELEILLTPETAQSWHVPVGSAMQINMLYTIQGGAITYDPFAPTQDLQALNKKRFRDLLIPARVVGLFTVPSTNLAYWHDIDFEPYTIRDHGQTYPGFNMLTSNAGCLHFFDQAASNSHIPAAFTEYMYSVNWTYHLDPAKLSITQMNDLIARVQALQSHFARDYGSMESAGGQIIPNTQLPDPYLMGIGLYGQVLHTTNGPSNLELFNNRVAVSGIPVLVISLQIIALILFFVSMMLDLLVERQMDAIAVLRSRGASGRQVFGALWTQGIWLSIFALLVGLPLALLVVFVFAQRELGLDQSGALDLITQHPVETLLMAVLFALAITAVSILTMALGLKRAADMDVLAIRRESARASRQPFWSRLYLDLVAAFIALVGYGVSVYVTSASSQLDVRSRALIGTPLTLVAPLFLAIGCTLLFLRFYPYLLLLAARLAGQGRGASSMLALAQMSRSPGQSVRMIMLLTFSLAFVIFSLVFSATQARHSSDLAAYEVGADFSGEISYGQSAPPKEEVFKGFRNLPGVASASIGVREDGSVQGPHGVFVMQIRGVDPATFAQTATWPATASSQPLSSIMAQLATQRSTVLQNNSVPVFVDAVAWDRLRLHIGSTFTINVSGLSYSDLPCRVIGKVEHIPTVNDSQDVTIAGETPPPGGVLLDYASYAQLYEQDSKLFSTSGNTLYPDYFWLRASSSATTAASLRGRLSALAKEEVYIPTINDRQSLVESLNHDPLTINLTGVLTLGTITTLLLALVGNLLASFLSARSRLVNFAVLRALGTTPAQLASVLGWEQVIIYTTSLLLGLLFGALFALTLVPNLVFSSTPATGLLSSLSNSEFYALQHILAVPPTLPLSLWATLAVLVGICLLSLAMMVRLVSRSSMAQTLRLNQD